MYLSHEVWWIRDCGRWGPVLYKYHGVRIGLLLFWTYGRMVGRFVDENLVIFVKNGMRKGNLGVLEAV